MIKIKKGSLYLITGGSGFLGESLIKYIINLGGNVRVLARNEGNLVKLKEKFNKIEIFPGSVSDKFEVEQSMKGVQGIFHLAASKHVGLSEVFCRETIKTNIIGTMNILEQSLNQPIEFILSISTDKAAQVNGVYGASKFLMERLHKQFEMLNLNCKYRIVRYGNVLYSTGSVLCKWKQLIEEGKDVIVTEPLATRFFWTTEQAIQLIDDCLRNSIDTTPYCPSMKSIKIEDLLNAMISKYSNGKNITVKKIGLQPGENLHEKILDEGPYSNECEQYTITEIMELI